MHPKKITVFQALSCLNPGADDTISNQLRDAYAKAVTRASAQVLDLNRILTNPSIDDFLLEEERTRLEHCLKTYFVGGSFSDGGGKNSTPSVIAHFDDVGYKMSFNMDAISGRLDIH